MNALKKPTVRTFLKKIITILLPIFSTLFIVGTTAVIIALINGYSLDIKKRTVIKTGVLNVETIPVDADISVSGEYYGKSNRAIPNVKIGTYTVSLSKEGYYPYTKRVEVQHGLASPVVASLLRTAGQKEIAKLGDAVAIDFNTTGYYILSTEPIVSESATTESATATPTPTKPKAKAESTTTYILTRVYITKPLFDDPQPVLDEKMTITTLSATPITSISISPTGKLLQVILTDKSGAKSVSLVPFKRNTAVNANLTDSKALTSYNRMKGTVLSWSEDGDYIIVETPEQIISYNVKAGTRVILAEKAELVSAGESLVWNATESGIVILRKAAGTKTDTYEISDISYNGNPLSTQLPSQTFIGKPTGIWSFSETDTPRYVISTQSGSYLLGKLFDAKESDYQITLIDEKIGETPIEHFADDYSKVKISGEAFTTPPTIVAGKNMVAFTEKSGTKLILFVYNKRSADKLTELGRKELYSGETGMTGLSTLAAASYITALTNNALLVVDTTGENVLTLQTGIKNFTLGQNDTALLFTNEQKALFFRILR